MNFYFSFSNCVKGEKGRIHSPMGLNFLTIALIVALDCTLPSVGNLALKACFTNKKMHKNVCYKKTFYFHSFQKYNEL